MRANIYANSRIRISILINMHKRMCVRIKYYCVIILCACVYCENRPVRKSLLYFRNYFHGVANTRASTRYNIIIIRRRRRVLFRPGAAWSTVAGLLCALAGLTYFWIRPGAPPRNTMAKTFYIRLHNAVIHLFTHVRRFRVLPLRIPDGDCVFFTPRNF